MFCLPKSCMGCAAASNHSKQQTGCFLQLADGARGGGDAAQAGVSPQRSEGHLVLQLLSLAACPLGPGHTVPPRVLICCLALLYPSSLVVNGVAPGPIWTPLITATFDKVRCWLDCRIRSPPPPSLGLVPASSGCRDPHPSTRCALNTNCCSSVRCCRTWWRSSARRCGPRRLHRGGPD